MTIDQDHGNPPAADSGGRDLPPTQPIDMTALLASERPTPGTHGMPHPVAASAHANRASGENPIAEWLGTLSPQANSQPLERPHRQYRRPTHD